ncbi:MAG: S1C family serine protease [Bdellovibrio sp.]|jgi:serine protease Do
MLQTAALIFLCFPLFVLADATDAYKEIKPLIFQVKVSANSSLDKNSYGTGFVVDRKGLLVTNYHVVAEAIWKPQHNKVFVEILKDRVEAQILAVDFVNDLALIQVPTTFDSEVRISKRSPPQGGDLFSLGLPEDVNWTVVRGVYNGFVDQGPYELIYMATPLNPGMSGGPTVNDKKELVAVNVSTHRYSQQISFGVPAKFVDAMMARYRTKPVEEADLIGSLGRQLAALQLAFKELIIEGYKDAKPIDSARLPHFSKKIRCWGSSKKDDDDMKFDAQTESCAIDQNISLSEGTSTGVFTSEFSVIKNKTMPLLSFNMKRVGGWGQYPAAMSVKSFDQDSKINFMPMKCSRERVTPKMGLMRTISVCLQSMMPLSEFYDVYIEAVVPLASGSYVHGELALGGLTLETVKDVTRAIIEHDYEVLVKP